jgi:alcohol dehydrogenase (cytochrome c)
VLIFFLSHADIRWRLEVLGSRANGELTDLSWGELITMIRPGSPYYLRNLTETPNPYVVIKNPYDSQADQSAGQVLFETHCASCHGRNANGGPHGPSLIAGSLGHGGSDWSIFRVTQRGIPDTSMPVLELDDRDRWQIVAFVQGLRTGFEEGNEATYKFPPNLSVSASRIRKAAEEPHNWMTYSGNYRGWRHTALSKIKPDNVHQLQLAWARQLGSDGWVETTPLVVEGVMYITVPPSDVWALDAADGRVIWTTELTIAEDLPVCCGRVNRGVAILENRVFVATLDGVLVGLDARSGKIIWKTRVAKPEDGYTLTVAPLAVDDKIIVGVSGGEYGIRGYVDAYRADDGSLEWRFDTIPEPGQPGNETWGGASWQQGGGATWVTGSYDPDLGLLYWGVGNPSPDFNKSVRPGDNLYTNSVIALDVNSGELAWHFQFTPADDHDYDSNQTPVLVDIEDGGENRRLILWANRNGFYYVLDRTNGQFVTTRPFVKVTWAESMDDTGRPILNLDATPSERGVQVWPSVVGGTNWWPPSYSPVDNLFFVPYLETAATFFEGKVEEAYDPGDGHQYLGGAFKLGQNINSGIKALDPKTGEVKWTFEAAPRDHTVQVGGVLSTATGLVFQGNLETFYGLRGDDGRVLWSVNLGGRINAPPMSYAVSGRQFVVLAAGSTLHAFVLPSARGN